MHRAAVAAGVIMALAVSSPAYSQGNSQAHKKKAPPSHDPLPSSAAGTSTGGAAPFSWLDDASVLEPGSVSVSVSMVRWQGPDTSEVVVPVVDVALYDMSGEKRKRGIPGWEEGEGVQSIFLVDHDLFAVRRVRVRTEEVAE